jgi:hypothetical protein
MRPKLDQVTASSSNHHAVLIRDVSLESVCRMEKLNNQYNIAHFVFLQKGAVRGQTERSLVWRESAMCCKISTLARAKEAG